MIASFGISSLLATLIYFSASNDARALYAAIAVYVVAGILLQRREGQVSARSGDHYYYYAGGNAQKRIPDPDVTWDWRIRVVLFWVPWLVVLRGEDAIVFALGSGRNLWQFALLGNEQPQPAEWRTRRRVFRSLPRQSDQNVASNDGRSLATSQENVERAEPLVLDSASRK